VEAGKTSLFFMLLPAHDCCWRMTPSCVFCYYPFALAYFIKPTDPSAHIQQKSRQTYAAVPSARNQLLSAQYIPKNIKTFFFLEFYLLKMF
jgi:hypothetical protein